MNVVPPNSLPINAMPQMINQQHNIFSRLPPLLNGMPWPTLSTPTKNMLLSPTLRMGMQFSGMELNKPINSTNGKIEDDNLPVEEQEKLKIKREKNALASRKCRQNKIRLINHWKDQADHMAQKLNAKELELEMFKAKFQSLLIHLNRKGVRLPSEFSTDLPISPETSVEETPSLNQPIIANDVSRTTNPLPSINSIQLPPPPTEQMTLYSITEHNKAVKELIDTALTNGAPINYQTQIYALPSEGNSQPSSTLTSPTVSLSNSEHAPMQVDVEGSGNSEVGENDDVGEFEDRPGELNLEAVNPISLGMRTMLMTPTLCMTVDTSSHRTMYNHNQPTGITPIITTKIIFSPTTLGAIANSVLQRTSP